MFHTRSVTFGFLALASAANAHPWRLGAPHDLESPVTVDEAVVGWTLEPGIVFPIVDDAGPGGFVFVGSSTLEVRFPDADDARATGNRLVALLDIPPQIVAPLGEGRPLEVVTANGGLVFGHDAWDRFDGAVRELERDPGAPPIVGVV